MDTPLTLDGEIENLRRSRPRSTPPQGIPLRDHSRNRSQPCPLSPSQQRLWFMEQLNPGVPVYNEAEAIRFTGQLNVEAMERALNVIISRHEMLRTTIQVADGEPMAIVHESWPLQIKKIDLSAMEKSARQAEVDRLLIHEPRRLYRLDTEPGIRATLLHIGPREHVFILMMHHIICDWSSEGVIWRELSALYRAFCCGEQLELAPLPIQHGDYAAWQHQNAKRGFAEDLAYWEENLRGAPELLELPTDRPRPQAISYRGARQRFRLDPILAESLRESSRREKTSLFTVFAAALDILLYRYTGRQDILVGIPLAVRDRPEIQPLIGFLHHTHALRTELSGGLTFRQLIGRVQKGMLGMYDHFSAPFDEVVSKIRPNLNLSYSPLFQVMLNWRDRDQQLSFIGMESLEIEPLLAETRTSKFNLTFMVTDAGNDIWLEIEYSTDLFDDARISRMVGHYQKLLEAVVANPDLGIAKLPLLTDAEHQQLLVDWNKTQADFPKDRCVHELVEEQARRAPDAVAVVFEDTQLTYRQLNDRANQLAHHLQQLGVGPKALVGVCIERSAEMVVGLLGILKAGAAYVPLDPSYPKERIEFMLADSGAAVLLTRRHLQAELRLEIPNCRILCLDTDWPAIATCPAHNRAIGVSSEDLVYVIYTSGSTGEPKGVEIPHRGLLNLIWWHRRTYQVSPVDRATQLAGVAFDASVWELWPYLTAGASIYMPDEDTRLLPERLRDWLVNHKITVSFLPTPLAETIITLPWPDKVALRAMLTGGDRLTRHVPATLPFPLINHYGPTESTVVTTCGPVTAEAHAAKAPPIGKPIANIQVYLLDEHLQPVPIGVPGELHVGGDGLARGYHNRPELTAEKFIPNPFAAKPGARLYKTGDLARYASDGTIEFLGRNDDQVKIRGFRIELGEIESVLTGHPGVQAAVVVAREDVVGEKRLVAYAAANSTIAQLRDYLKTQLPEYMVPSAFVILDKLPLTPNGKVDRAALPAPDSASTAEDAFTAPSTDVEKAVAGILAPLLGLAQVDAQANFFSLGGHSLLGTQLITRIREVFGIELPLRKVFEAPTVAELAADIEQMLFAEVEAMSEEEAQHSLASEEPAHAKGVAD